MAIDVTIDSYGRYISAKYTRGREEFRSKYNLYRTNNILLKILLK